MLVLGLYLRYLIKYIITLSCRHCFEMREYREILLTYSEQHRSNELSIAQEPSDVAVINELYDYCSKNIVYERFRYYK